MNDSRYDLLRVEFLKAAPAVAGAAFTLNHLVTALTAIYVLIQTAYLVWKWRREIRAARTAAPSAGMKAAG